MDILVNVITMFLLVVYKNMFLTSRRFVIGDYYFVSMHGKCPDVKHQIDDDRLYCFAWDWNKIPFFLASKAVCQKSIPRSEQLP